MMVDEPTPTLIKIEDSIQNGSNGNCNALAPYSIEPKSTAIQTATITTAVQTNEMTPDIATQLSNYYQAHGLHGNLIQIAPHTTTLGGTQTLSNNGNNPTITIPPLLNTFDCRSMQSHAMPNILTPPDITVSTMSCLTPISETYSRSEENLDSSGVSTLPEGEIVSILSIVFYINLPSKK